MSGQKGVLIISALDYWSMGEGKGGPALYRTLTGYANRDWKVYFITGNRAEGASDRVHENIQITRFDAPWLKRLIQIRKIGFFAKILWWLYFQIVAFIKAQKLRSKTKIDIVYGYEIYGLPVAKLLSNLWVCLWWPDSKERASVWDGRKGGFGFSGLGSMLLGSECQPTW